MRERTGLILKLACFALAALLFYQLVQAVLRANPLGRVAIPALPTLASSTNAPTTGAPTSGLSRGSTNSAATNPPAKMSGKETGTNFVIAVVGMTNATHSAQPTNPPLSSSEGEKEKVTALAGGSAIPTNAINGTNTITASPASVSTQTTNFTGTNALAKPTPPPLPVVRPAQAAMAMSPSMMRGGRPGATELPPEIKARVDRIYESELFGQIMRPQPMALQGIAGNMAFLRAPSGQTGLVKEGDMLGEIKLLRIGVNRVLVEQGGKKTELTIFNGYGGESLMPKDKETSK